MTTDGPDLAELERRLPPWTRELIDCLTPRRRQALVLREASGMTFDEIGHRLDVSPSRASQLYAAAVRVLTHEARRAALIARHAPEIVTHSPPTGHQRCAVPEQMRAALELPLEVLNLGVRGMNSLENSSIRTVGELVRRHEGELLKIKNLGRKTLREIKEGLAGLGLHLGMDTSAHEPQRG